jgi:hypothetical protein
VLPLPGAIQTMLVLGIAQQQNVVRRNRVAGREIHKPAGRPDLIAAEYPAMPFDRLHQRAGLALVGGSPLAVAVGDQSGLGRIKRFGTRRETVSGKKANIRRLLAFDPLKL